MHKKARFSGFHTHKSDCRLSLGLLSYCCSKIDISRVKGGVTLNGWTGFLPALGFPLEGNPPPWGKGPHRRGGQEGASEAKWGMHQAIQVGQPSAGQTMLRAVAASPDKRRCCCRKRRVKNALPLLSISHKPCRSAHRQVRVCPSGAVSPSAGAGAHTFARCCAQEASPCALAYHSCRSRVLGTSVISADLSE